MPLTVLAAVIAASAQAKQPAMRGDLGLRPARLAGAERVFDWEVAHRADARRRSRKLIQCGIDLPAFCVVPFAGLLVYWVSGRTSTGLVVLSAAEALTIVGLGMQVVAHAAPFRAPGAAG
ncbi:MULTISPECIES: hypothetical protein [Streptomyces]|uniref:hypothetical protein n=1 Tax=Streptomyces TaxID=1883 RepID=UPI00069886FD|nr:MULTISPECIES: hypothetical protein [Streptomyces]